MKADDDKIVLSIKYSFIDHTKGETVHKTEIKHFFVASDKKKLLSKIKTFEHSLKSKKKTATMAHIKAYLKHYIESWKYTQKNMMKI